MTDPGEDDEVPRSYADLFVARLGRIVQSTEMATFRVEEAFGGKRLLPVSYFRASDVSPRHEVTITAHLTPLVLDCVSRVSDACVQLPNGRWCLIILLGRSETPEAAAAFLVTASDKKKAMTRLKLLQGAAKR
ncbi:MAG TPA: hypothetical protein VLJ39_09180 [Tepidisphaeraceae bacterium]|nr:hypothetical protein [Tepidisphaeraceae bacterium]